MIILLCKHVFKDSGICGNKFVCFADQPNPTVLSYKCCILKSYLLPEVNLKCVIETLSTAVRDKLFCHTEFV